MKLIRAYRKNAKNEFLKIGLTQGKPKILDFLIDNSGCSQRELASYCKIEPATATSILAGMEKENLLYIEKEIQKIKEF